MPATYAEHKCFCVIDKWTPIKSARGKTPDHFYFNKTLRNGDLLRTKVSHGAGEYGPGLWHKIWKHQLRLVEEEQFFAALRTKTPVKRPEDEAPGPPQHARLPYDLFKNLVEKLGIDEATAAELTVEQAAAKMAEYWSRPPEER
jgi:hypothetical protein